MRTLPLRSSVIVAGDFNSNLCAASPCIGHSVLHNQAKPAVIEERRWLTGMLVAHQLAALNSWSRKQCTYNHPSGSSQIDWILVRSALADTRARTCAPAEAPIAGWRSSGHKLLRASVPLRWRPWKLSQKREAKDLPTDTGPMRPLAALRREIVQSSRPARETQPKPGVAGMEGDILRFWDAKKLLTRKPVHTLRDIFERMRMLLTSQAAKATPGAAGTGAR